MDVLKGIAATTILGGFAGDAKRVFMPMMSQLLKRLSNQRYPGDERFRC